MKNNSDLQEKVQAAIQWEPSLKESQINVAADNGLITLTGTVKSHLQQLKAEEIVRHVLGVKAIIEKLEITHSETTKQSDADLVKMVVNALHWNWGVSDKKISVTAQDGWVTLGGEQQWRYQKEAAQNAVVNLIGVKGLTNNITLKSVIHDEVEKKDVERALGRSSAMNNLDVKVDITGNRVTLSGEVHSFFQKYEAEKIAFKAPGVWTVNNQLTIEEKTK